MTTTVRVGRAGGRVLIELGGEIDMDSVRNVEPRLDHPFDAPVVVDLANVAFIDSSGLALLARLASKAAAGGHGLSLVAPPTCIARRLLDIVDLGIPMRDSLAEFDSDRAGEGVTD